MKRYDIEPDIAGEPDLFERDNGEWVRYEDVRDELEQMRAELDKTTKWCAALVWAADQVDEPTIAEIRAYVDRLVMTKGREQALQDLADNDADLI